MEQALIHVSSFIFPVPSSLGPILFYPKMKARTASSYHFTYQGCAEKRVTLQAHVPCRVCSPVNTLIPQYLHRRFHWRLIERIFCELFNTANRSHHTDDVAVEGDVWEEWRARWCAVVFWCLDVVACCSVKWILLRRWEEASCNLRSSLYPDMLKWPWSLHDYREKELHDYTETTSNSESDDPSPEGGLWMLTDREIFKVSLIINKRLSESVFCHPVSPRRNTSPGINTFLTGHKDLVSKYPPNHQLTNIHNWMWQHVSARCFVKWPELQEIEEKPILRYRECDIGVNNKALFGHARAFCTSESG